MIHGQQIKQTRQALVSLVWVFLSNWDLFLRKLRTKLYAWLWSSVIDRQLPLQEIVLIRSAE